MEEELLWRVAAEIPPEWYNGEWVALEKLVGTLIARRGIVRDLIEAFRDSSRNPFPEWDSFKGCVNSFSRVDNPDAEQRVATFGKTRFRF